jgi:hypothetical protein
MLWLFLETDSSFLSSPTWLDMLLFVLPSIAVTCPGFFPLRESLQKFISTAMWNHDPSDFSLPDSWEDRPLPLYQAIS